MRRAPPARPLLMRMEPRITSSWPQLPPELRRRGRGRWLPGSDWASGSRLRVLAPRSGTFALVAPAGALLGGDTFGRLHERRPSLQPGLREAGVAPCRGELLSG